MNSFKFYAVMVAMALSAVGLFGFQMPANAALSPVLGCTFDADGGGDRADMRGIRFTLHDDFQAVELIMSTFSPGIYIFTAELRHSSGFTDPPIRTLVKAVEFKAANTPTLVHLEFQKIQVPGSETFTLKFVNFSGPESSGYLYFETINDRDYCSEVEETERNTSSTPVIRSNDPWLRVLGQGNPSALSIHSSYVTSPPNIDGTLGFGEWPISSKFEFENGFFTVVNDSHRLYILVDVTADTVQDDGDYFWLTFDVNRDGEITPDADIQYATNPYTGEMRYQYYTRPGGWTGLQPDTFSSMGEGFGCFFSDGTLFLRFNPLQRTCNRHRVLEFGIDLAEIGARAGGMARMGLRLGSNTPGITENIPENFYLNFTNLIEIQLSSSGLFTYLPNSALEVTLNQGSFTDAVEVSQAIQDRSNSLPLVEEKKAVARVYSQADSTVQPGIVSLYGSQNGVDLPGSPLAVYHNSPTVIDREDIQDTANFILPKSWTRGDITFKAVVRDLFTRPHESSDIFLHFTQTRVPTYWTLALNTGTVGSPTLLSDTKIDEQEAFLEAMYPFPDIKFVRKSWDAVGVTSVSDAIDDLNYYYSIAVLAWILSGGSFDLPDQVYGFVTSGGGLSDPLWCDGLGRVARGADSHEGIMAHEIIHNLGPGDCDDGRDLWGRHVSNRTSGMTNGWCIAGDGTVYGCGASGADAGWQDRFDDAEIHEVGIDTSVSPFRLVPADKPEVMSYCEDSILPSVWISDYRWGKMVNHFRTAAAADASASTETPLANVQPTLYIRGEVYPDKLGGGGTLHPAMVQPGLPMTQEDVQPGIYAVELWPLKGTIPLYLIRFGANFTGDNAADWNDEPRDHFTFNFQLPAPEGVAEIRLTRTEEKETRLLDVIKVGQSSPEVTVLSPRAGETWKGIEVVRWQAQDNDGDLLSFSLLYSPDRGKTWIPMAPEIETRVKGENDYFFEVDTATLPAGASSSNPTSLIRVIASDGYNTSEDDSELFFLIPNPPRAVITSPAVEQTFLEASPITFIGTAQDQEDGIIPDEQMIWFHNGTQFGIGSEFQAILPYGTHDITLKAVDSNDQEGSTSVLIYVIPVCQADLEPDGDVDGSDLAVFAKTLAGCQTGTACMDGLDLNTFASDFGKTGCIVNPQ